MLLRTPNFYTKFHCKADKCTDTCCIGWEIDIDEASQAKYRNINGDFGKKMKSSIKDGHFILNENDICPFLNKCGLCEIYLHLGEDALCDICREHPRFVEVYGDVKEQGIGLCCEEGVRLLLEESVTTKNAAQENERKAPIIQFTEREIDDIPDELPDDARDARDQIFNEREDMFAILSLRENPLNKRLLMLLKYAVEMSGISEDSCTNNAADIHANNAADIAKIYCEWIKILGKGESFGPAWDKAYKAISENGWRNSSNKNNHIQKNRRNSLFNDDDGAKIVAYMLFRYYAKSLFDGDSLGKVQFAIFFWIILREFGQELAGISENEVPAADPKNKFIDPRIATVKLLSKQVEYSDEVMDTLAKAFADNKAFSVESILLLLQEK